MSEGTIDHHALRRARVSLADILASAHDRHGLKRLDQIDCAVLEIGSAVSIIPKQGQ